MQLQITVMLIHNGIFTLKITHLTDSHEIKITNVLRNYYKLLGLQVIPFL